MTEQTMVTLSLQRALDKINLLDKKITDGTTDLRDSSLITYVVGNKTVSGFKDNEDFATKAKAKLQSVMDLIEQRDRLKTAIINKNATTEITVGTETMTIAAAIERRSSIVNRRNLLNQMRHAYMTTIMRFQQEENRYREGLNAKLEAIYGKENKTKHDMDSDLLKPYRETNEPKLLDPLELKDEIDALNEYINVFDNDIKFALTEANVRNDIQIPE